MKINFTKSLLALFIMAMTFGLHAQLPTLEYIWGGPNSTGQEKKNSQFDGGLNDWTTEGISCKVADSLHNAIWKWTADGALGGAYFNPIQIINSPSISNGAVAFDSDGLDNAGIAGNFGKGLCPAPQKSALISPTLDFTGEPAVAICFYQSFRNFTALTSVEVSKDGGNSWNSFPVVPNDFTALNNAATNDTSNTMFINMDISSVAANESNVRVRFIFDGTSRGYYFWTIDDVAFIKPLPRDVDITMITVPAATLVQPLNPGVNCDVMQFRCRVAATNMNVISTDEYELKVEVIKEEGTVLFTGLTTVDSVVFEEQEVVFPTQWAPVNEPGEYTVRYSVVNSDDEITYNNDREGSFFVSDDPVFDAVIGSTSFPYSATPPTKVYGQFAFFSICDNVDEGLDIYVDSITYAVDWEGPDGTSIVGKSVKVYIEEVLDKNNPFPEDPGLDWKYDKWKLVGQYEHVFTSDNELKVDLHASTFTSKFGAELTPGVRLYKDSLYAVCLVSQKDISYRNGRSPINGARYSGLVVDSGVFGGYGQTFSKSLTGRILPVDIKMTVKFLVDTKTVQLPENTLKVIQNPVNDELRLKMEFEKSSNVSYAIGTMTGSILSSGRWSSVNNRIETLDVSNLSNGSYLIRIQTPDGIATKTFIVAK